MRVFLPSTPMSLFVESYHLTTSTEVGMYQLINFPAVSSGYLKFSAHACVISGQTILPTKITSNWDFTGLGVKLRIGAIYTLLGIPAHELTNRTIALEDILGNSAVELIEQISESSTPAEKIKHIENTFIQLAQQNSKRVFSPEFAILESLINNRTLPISQLADEVGYSPRQLQRKLNDFLGLPPRLFKRIIRFEKILQAIQVTPPQRRISWSALAFSYGYSDQAHFVREFQEFTGYTPTAYMAKLKMSDTFNPLK